MESKTQEIRPTIVAEIREEISMLGRQMNELEERIETIEDALRELTKALRGGGF